LVKLKLDFTLETFIEVSVAKQEYTGTVFGRKGEKTSPQVKNNFLCKSKTVFPSQTIFS
jgi:hypothetical protein